jgi:uncharacterized protein
MSRFDGRFRGMTCALAILALLLAGGCGFKDKPVPPQHVVPKAVLDLQVELDEQGATLSWTYPTETVTGGNVEEIDGFALYRAEVPVNSYCKTCPVPYDPPIAVPGGTVPPNSRKTATHEIKNLRPGNLYFFKVRSKTGWWSESQDSNAVSFFWQTPPMTPEGLAATSGDGQNTLHWQPVVLLRDATPTTVPVRYQLYRGVDGGPLAKIGQLLAAHTYIDSMVENDRVYSYQVQALSTYEQGTVNSGLSETVQVKPLDRTAPPVPKGVEGIRTEVGVKIYWNHVEAADLAGYRVYRRSEGEGKAVFIGEVNLPYNMYIDSKAAKGPHFYSVSSIDARSPVNESTRSPEIRIDH